MTRTGWKAQRKAIVRWWRSQFLLLLARLWRPLLFRTTFIAITGSVGKSTCKECLAAILSAHFPTAKTLFNQNERDGVPSHPAGTPWHRYAGSRSHRYRASWAGRRACCAPDISIVLAIADALQDFATRTISRRKSTLLESQIAWRTCELNATIREGTRAVHCRPGCGRRDLRGTDLRADESLAWPGRLSLGRTLGRIRFRSLQNGRDTG